MFFAPNASITPKPSTPGICTSRKTMSGRSSWMSVTAATPFFASRTRPTSRSRASMSVRRLRAGASSSTTRTRIGSGDNPMPLHSCAVQRDKDRDGRSSVFAAMHGQTLLAYFRIECAQAFARYPQSVTAGPFHSPVARQADAVVDHLNPQLVRALRRGNDNRPPRYPPFDPVTDRVLEQGLQQHRWHHGRQRLGLHIDPDIDSVAETDFLDGNIMVEEGQFLGQRN